MYETVGKCPRTGKPYLTPKVWSNKKRPKPVYPTCSCCEHKRKR